MAFPRPTLGLLILAALVLAPFPARADPLTDLSAAPCMNSTSGHVCIRIVPTQVLFPVAFGRLETAVTAVLSIEQGNLTAYTHLDYASQDILLVQANDAPAGGALNVNVGTAGTRYTPEDEECVFRECRALVAWAPGLQKAGDVWQARLQIVKDGNIVTDVPFLTVILDTPALFSEDAPEANEDLVPFARDYAGA